MIPLGLATQLSLRSALSLSLPASLTLSSRALGGKRSFFYLLEADKRFRSCPLYASPFLALAYKEVNLDRFSVSTLKVNTKGRANPSLQLDYHRSSSTLKGSASHRISHSNEISLFVACL